MLASEPMFVMPGCEYLWKSNQRKGMGLVVDMDGVRQEAGKVIIIYKAALPSARQHRRSKSVALGIGRRTMCSCNTWPGFISTRNQPTGTKGSWTISLLSEQGFGENKSQ